jgi:hypothetical protein
MREHTEAYDAWMATGASRETSPAIMRALWLICADPASAEFVWENGLAYVDEASTHAFMDMVSSDGTKDPRDFVWGAAGADWQD